MLDCTGNGSDADVIAGIEWVTANAVKPAVANMSIGGSLSVAMNDAVQRSIASGVTYVVGAANDAGDACNGSPASAPNAVTVGAVTNADAQANFSNWGTCVDLYAPGVNVMSALNSGDNVSGPASGTSMASPHAAGAAALYLQSHPSASPADVANALVSTATAGALTGLGAGSPNRLLRVNVVAVAPAPPPAPAPAPAPVVTNSPPTARFNFKCNKNNCSFDASTSTDNAGVVGYKWSFGDVSASATLTVSRTSHVYSSKGNFSVTLTALDAEGLSSSVVKTVSVTKMQ